MSPSALKIMKSRRAAVGCICRPAEEENFSENLFGSGSLEHRKDNIKIDLGLWG
jgi:hypothetical protein